MGVVLGKLIEFYHPQPKPAPQQEVPEIVERISPSDILREVLEHEAENVDTILILMMDKNGETGMVSNLAGPGESFLFIEQIKADWLAKMKSEAPAPKGTA